MSFKLIILPILFLTYWGYSQKLNEEKKVVIEELDCGGFNGNHTIRPEPISVFKKDKLNTILSIYKGSCMNSFNYQIIEDTVEFLFFYKEQCFCTSEYQITIPNSISFIKWGNNEITKIDTIPTNKFKADFSSKKNEKGQILNTYKTDDMFKVEVWRKQNDLSIDSVKNSFNDLVDYLNVKSETVPFYWEHNQIKDSVSCYTDWSLCKIGHYPKEILLELYKGKYLRWNKQFKVAHDTNSNNIEIIIIDSLKLNKQRLEITEIQIKLDTIDYTVLKEEIFVDEVIEHIYPILLRHDTISIETFDYGWRFTLPIKFIGSELEMYYMHKNYSSINYYSGIKLDERIKIKEKGKYTILITPRYSYHY